MVFEILLCDITLTSRTGLTKSAPRTELRDSLRQIQKNKKLLRVVVFIIKLKINNNIKQVRTRGVLHYIIKTNF